MIRKIQHIKSGGGVLMAVLRGVFIALNVCIMKKKSQLHNWSSYLKKLEKGGKNNSK